ncbi:MAG: nitroreductase family protein [Elusimicrobiota bacterium]|jgi:hypothetical protein|nr:nitroreductase family protein [Elusimicrobiota bacterium]
MKKLFLALLAVCFFCLPALAAQKTNNIKLPAPQLTKGKTIMQALSERQSVRDWSKKDLDTQTLANLVWAATGVNRPNGKRTNATAMDLREIDIYVCNKNGAYFYNAKKHMLEFITKESCGEDKAPVIIFITAKAKEDATYPYIDAGIVSENIYLFASGMGLATVARGTMPMDKAKIAKLLKLGADTKLILNHPVGYAQSEKKDSKKEAKK